MKHTILLLLSFLTYFTTNAENRYNIFSKLKQIKPNTGNVPGKTTYIQFASSITGPFTSPATLSTRIDSLLTKVDCAPLGTIEAEYWLDVNENNII
ncbi:MAG: hypothetical protein KGZ58_12335, partial [Ignavibacteriales bacterium]|nr:hypothetical protein [Ignavibacteriales bacterium]